MQQDQWCRDKETVHETKESGVSTQVGDIVGLANQDQVDELRVSAVETHKSSDFIWVQSATDLVFWFGALVCTQSQTTSDCVLVLTEPLLMFAHQQEWTTVQTSGHWLLYVLRVHASAVECCPTTGKQRRGRLTEG